MKDVGRLAGVSAMTVSRALCNPDKVAKETLERIRQAIKETGYVPDLNAGGLSSKRTRTVTAVIPSFNNSNVADVLHGLSDVLNEESYQIYVAGTEYSFAEEANAIRSLLGRRPDAIVILGGQHLAATRKLLETSQIPVVETLDIPESPIDMAVGISNYDGAYNLAHRLAERGYKNIAFLGGATHRDPRGEQRLSGFAAAMQELGLPEHLIVQIGDGPLPVSHGGHALRAIVDMHPEVDAAMCVSDVSAMGAMMECHRRGWSIPERVAIAGFGDFDFATQLHPRLTTVSVHGKEIGRQAGQLILDRLEGRSVETKIIDVGFKIIERESS